MLMLMVARRGAEGDRLVRAGAWTGWGPTHLLGTRVSGKTLGLIGLGRIGRAVAQRAHHGFGMRVIFHDPYPPPPAVVAELGAEPRGSVDDVLREADFVSRHARDPDRHGPPGARQPQGVFLRRLAARPGGVSDEELARTAGLLRDCFRDVIRTHQPEIERVLAGERLDPQAPPELVARAIQAQGMWFQLLSLAEQNAAMRQRRQSEVSRGYDQLRGTFAQVVSAAARGGVAAEEMRAVVANLRVRPVITAHPTEAKRVTVLEKQRRIYRRLVDRRRPGRQPLRHERRHASCPVREPHRQPATLPPAARRSAARPERHRARRADRTRVP